jgi:hypothetical protein
MSSNQFRATWQKGQRRPIFPQYSTLPKRGSASDHGQVIDSVARLSFSPYSGCGPEKLGNIRKVIED